jgi:uncharacterized protein (DUF433 family)
MPARKSPAPLAVADKNTVKQIGRYIVADPRICHGQLTIRGTRILVSVILEQLEAGYSIDTIVREWEDRVPREAVAEIMRVAHQTFLEHASEFTPPDTRRRVS